MPSAMSARTASRCTLASGSVEHLREVGTASSPPKVRSDLHGGSPDRRRWATGAAGRPTAGPCSPNVIRSSVSRWRARARPSAASVSASRGMSAGPIAAQRRLTCSTSSSSTVFRCLASADDRRTGHQVLDGPCGGPRPGRPCRPGRGRQRLDQPARRPPGRPPAPGRRPAWRRGRGRPSSGRHPEPRQEVEQELQVEGPQVRVAHRGQPGGDAGGWVVGDVLDVERLRADRRQLDVVGLGHERLGPSRRPATPRRASRAARSPVSAPSGEFGHLVPGQAGDGALPVGVGGEGAEGLGEPCRAAALGDDGTRDEPREHRVGHRARTSR